MNRIDTMQRLGGLGALDFGVVSLETAKVLWKRDRKGEAESYLERAKEGLDRALAAHAQGERLIALYALQAAALRAIQQPVRAAEARRLAAAWGAHALGRDHPDVRRLSTNP